MVDEITLLSFAFSVTGVGIAILIYHRQKSQSDRVEELTTEIHGYVSKQKGKEKIIRADYARRLLGLINFARMKVHGMNAQIKFLKKIASPVYSSERLKEESWRRESVRKYQHELQELMIKANIDQNTILEVFGEQTQLLYNKMWKCFCWNDMFITIGEDYFESFIDFVNTGVEASKELYDILIKHIPENERKQFRLTPTEVEEK